MSNHAADPAAYCMDQVRRFDHDRYLTALFAPPPQRPAVLALYAFNLEIARIRESVRELMIGQIRLQWWRDALAEARDRRPRQHLVILALAPLLVEGRLNAERLDELLTARELDMRDVGIESLAELDAYVAGTSSTLVQLVLDLLGGANDAARQAGQHVGMAWGLTGLLRAVPFHARQRRRYLPADLLQQAGISDDDLVEGRAGARLAPAVRQLADLAATHLQAARARRRELPTSSLPALLPATLADLYLRRIARHDFDLFAPALQAPLGSRALRLALAAWRHRY